jgi:hypothetical protein
MTAKIQGGAILLARQSFERWLWSLTGNQIKVFLWLLYRARWKRGPEPWFDGREVVQIERGQLVTSPDSIAKANGVSRGCVRKALAVLEKTETIRANARANRYTIVTICNYDYYQDHRNYQSQRESQPRANREPTESQPRATEGIQGIRESRESGNQRSEVSPKASNLVKTESAAVREDASAPPDPVLAFPCAGKTPAWTLTEGHIATWAGLYEGLKVEAECRKALAWILADTKRRKTAGGMERFLVGWLNRANDNGSHGHAAPRETVEEHNRRAGQEWLRSKGHSV